MAWVRSEYTGELSVLSAWLAMVLPWNIVYHTDVPTETIRSVLFAARLSVVELQFRFPGTVTVDDDQVYSAAESFDALFSGVHVGWDLFVTTPPMAIAHHDGLVGFASIAWALASLALLVSFVISIALYLRQDAVEQRSPEDPVRLIGVCLGVAALATGAASVLYFLERDLVGIPIPIGVVVMGALSVALLRVERR